MSGLAFFTLVHVIISLVAIAAGFVVLLGMIANKRLERWTTVFLTTTLATSATGFGFPFERLLPSHTIALISLVLLTAAIHAYYFRQLAGAWRGVYVVTATIALYLNVFVLVAQLFLKIPPLKTLAPTQTEWPFAVVQLATLVAFLALGARAWRGFRPAAVGKPGRRRRNRKRRRR